LKYFFAVIVSLVLIGGRCSVECLKMTTYLTSVIWAEELVVTWVKRLGFSVKGEV
jgi:hypothetical protein